MCLARLIALSLVLLPLALSGTEAPGFLEVEDGEQPDHLVPIEYPDAYDQRIAKHLFLTDGDLGRFVYRPSFSPESCLSVHMEVSDEAVKKHGWFDVPDSEKKYFLTLTTAKANLWYTMAGNNAKRRTEAVKVRRVDREISRDLAVAIQRTWARMLQNTRYPRGSSIGRDGVTYEFSVYVRGLGDLHGKTWSPRKGLPADIATLGMNLIVFIDDPQAEEQPFIKRLRALEEKIPKLD